MRILSVEGRFFDQAFRNLGHQVLAVGGQGADVVLDAPMPLARLLEVMDAHGFVPDLAVWSDMCRVPSVMGLESLPCVTVGFSIDQYLNPWHVPYSASFDLALVAQQDYLDLFRLPSIDRPALWFPLFCEPSRLPGPDRERDIPVSFVGTLDGCVNQDRRRFLESFRQLHPLVVHRGDFVPVYGRSRIVLNQSAAGELNFRLFEGAACGAAVLTEDTGNGLRDLFTPGRDIRVYPRGNPGAAARAARDALGDPAGLAALAQAGRRAVLAAHTAPARARAILRQAEDLLRAGAPARRLARGPLVREELSKAYLFLATDEALPIPAAHRRFFADLGRAYAALD